MASGNELTLRQVVVALDAAADFAPAIELAGIVAAGWRADLRGLFAEDERLQRLACLPFAQQLDPITALRSPISPAGLRAETAALAERMRQELKHVADRHGLAWSFQMTESIRRGALVVDSDELLVVGVSSRPIVSQWRLHAPWQGIVGDLRQRLLLVRRGAAARASVVVLHDAGEAGHRALEAAIRIAAVGMRPLTIAMPEHAPEARRAEALAAARDAGVAAGVVVLSAVSPAALRSVMSSPIDLLVMAGDGQASGEDLDGLLQSVSGAVLIV